ncbi:MAG: TetR/AcrR family transcriptional regulator [Segniliparus sp.]|uniref:TetR/AcrR family transcriptional regulator n=1 Tax=Segniliparus sp. TaxID=2804064 RepID=UPI003F395ABF
MADRRATRWDSHRAQVRAELVEAAFRAVDQLGPDVSMQEIAAEAGKPKPTLYRYFADRGELFEAVADRVKELITERVVVLPMSSAPTARELLRLGLTGYADLLAAHPNVFRALMNDMLLGGGASRVLDNGRLLASEIAAMLGDVGEQIGGPKDNVELPAAAIVGAVAAAADWWMKDGVPKTSVEQFVAQLEAVLAGMVEATAKAEGFMLDFDAPLYAFARPLAANGHG